VGDSTEFNLSRCGAQKQRKRAAT